MPCSTVSSDAVALGLVAAPMGTPAVKGACWFDPVTWVSGRRVGVGLWLWLFLAAAGVRRRAGGVKLERPQRAPSGAGEDERAWCRQAGGRWSGARNSLLQDEGGKVAVLVPRSRVGCRSGLTCTHSAVFLLAGRSW